MNELTRAIVAGDEFRHQPGPQPGWRENWWLCYFDQKQRLHGMVYTGVTPNRGVGFAMFCIWENDRPLFIIDQSGLPLTSAEPALGGAGPVRFRCEVPMHRWNVQVQNSHVTADLTWTALAPAYDWNWGEVTESRHFEQSGAVTGRITVNGRILEIDGCGQRDRAWGNRPPTLLDQAWSSRVLYSPTDLQHASIITVKGKPHLFGYRIRDGQAELIDSLALHVAYGYPGGPPVSTELKAWSGQTLIADQQVRILNCIPRSDIQNGTDSRQFFTFSDWFEGGSTGIGQLDFWWAKREAISEHLTANGNNGVWVAQ